jgi:hypothetical protein
MSTLHEQAWDEATRRFGGDETRAEQRGADWKDGFLAGHKAATRTRVVTTVDELDALPVGSVVVLQSGQVFMRDDDDEFGWITPGDISHWTSAGVFPDAPARVLYEPEEKP